MSAKMNGADFKAFYNDKEHWKDGAWHEDATFMADDVDLTSSEDWSKVEDTAVVVIDDGFVTNDSGKDLGTIDAFFRKWKKKQTSVSFIVTCAKDGEAALKAIIKLNGGKFT